jgi:superfamily II DNA/RNA helicase
MNTHCEEEEYSFESMKMFNEAHGPPNLDLLQGVTNYGWESPSKIQQKTVDHIYQGRNVIGQAHSGSGKTGAFTIGALSLLDPTKNQVQIIVIANTHELAKQSLKVIRAVGNRVLRSDAQVELCIGQSVSPEENIRNIRTGRQILVGTPGRIRDLVCRRIGGKPLIDPHHVKLLILDEADCLLTDKFRDVTIDIVDALDDPRNGIQLAIFSATFSPESLDVARKLCVPDKDKLGEKWTEEPTTPFEILVPVENLTLKDIQQYYYELDCDPRNSFRQKVEFILALNDIAHLIPMCMIYVNNKGAAEKLKFELDKQELACECIYGSMTGHQRQHITDAFRRCETRILISTDLLGRGFDVQQVELVINFDLPYVIDRNTGEINKDKMAEYLHRIGRGGRFNRRGTAINIIAGATERNRMEAIEEYYSTQIELLPDDISQLY